MNIFPFEKYNILNRYISTNYNESGKYSLNMNFLNQYFDKIELLEDEKKSVLKRIKNINNNTVGYSDKISKLLEKLDVKKKFLEIDPKVSMYHQSYKDLD